MSPRIRERLAHEELVSRVRNLQKAAAVFAIRNSDGDGMEPMATGEVRGYANVLRLLNGQETEPPMTGVKMYLDDMRPCPEGWVLAQNFDQAVGILRTGMVVEADLDHDLGYCDACNEELHKQLEKRGVAHTTDINCRHQKTGLDLLKWMLENKFWPAKVTVHSANPVGAKNMGALIGEITHKKEFGGGI